jgi:hypothetical protein
VVSVSGRVAPDAVRLDQHRQRRLADLRMQGRDEALLGQQRRRESTAKSKTSSIGRSIRVVLRITVMSSSTPQ